MAEIHVQTKKHNSNPAWIWIVVVLLIAAAVIYFLTRNNKTNGNHAVNNNSATSYLQEVQPVGGVPYTAGLLA